MNLFEQVSETCDWLNARISEVPALAMVLGSGLGALAEDLEDAKSFAYEDIPNFPTSSVIGHEGTLVFGRLSGKYVVVMQGRSHFYEGLGAQRVTMPMRVFGQMGICL